MSSISFVPRSVKRRKIEVSSEKVQVSSNVVSLNETSAGASPASEDHPPTRPAGPSNESKSTARDRVIDQDPSTGVDGSQRILPDTGKIHTKVPDLEDLAFLLWLSLSDYALWSDPDLRRKIGLTSQPHDDTEAGEANLSPDDERGFISLAYLRRHSAVFHAASSSTNLVDHAETIYVKAIRTHASHLLDVRLIVSKDGSASRSTTYRTKQLSSPVGYEVRRKSPSSTLVGHGKSDWHNLTIYVENIPIQNRNLPGVAKIVSSLLTSSSETRLAKIQSVFFPPHHNDKPGSIPVCKGFALVTLSDAHDLQFLLEKWSWDVERQISKDLASPLEKEARRFGLRCLSKTRWEELRAEYLLYRQQLVEELNAENAAQHKISRGSSNIFTSQEPTIGSEHEAVDPGKAEPSTTSTINSDSRFPPGCLVFIRHVHPETNKTTLRALLSQAWRAGDGSSAESDGIDYVDYLKGVDTCHLRFRSPAAAKHFVEYFSTHPTIQTSGLDGIGTLLPASDEEGIKSRAIMAESVSGKREEVYWDKIPEKVRRQAVEKALGTLKGHEGKFDNAHNKGSVNKQRGRK